MKMISSVEKGCKMILVMIYIRTTTTTIKYFSVHCHDVKMTQGSPVIILSDSPFFVI